jgi:hypothetical protein
MAANGRAAAQGDVATGDEHDGFDGRPDADMDGL